MTYEVIKTIKGNRYRYLVKSVREGDKVRQVFVRYLGRAGEGERKSADVEPVEREVAERPVATVPIKETPVEIKPTPEVSNLEAEKAVQELVNELRTVRQQRLDNKISQKESLERQRDIAQRAIDAEPLDIAKETWRGILYRTETELAGIPDTPVPVEATPETIVQPVEPKAEVKPKTASEERLANIEYGTKEISLPIKDDFSDYLTLKELSSKLEDGLYTAGDNYVYSVEDGKVNILPQYRSRYDYDKNKFVYTEREVPPEDIAQVPIFHGSVHKDLELTDLSLERSGQNFAGVGGNEFAGIYFTTRPSDAKGYASLSKVGGTLIESRISPDAKVIRYKDVGARDTSQLLKDGVDVVLKYEKGGDIGEVIVLNPKVLQAPTSTAVEVAETPAPAELTPEVVAPPKVVYVESKKDLPNYNKYGGAYEALSDVEEGIIYITKDASKGTLEHEQYHILQKHPDKPIEPLDYARQELEAELYAHNNTSFPKRIKGRLIGWANDIMWRRYNNSPEDTVKIIGNVIKDMNLPDRWTKDWSDIKSRITKLDKIDENEEATLEVEKETPAPAEPTTKPVAPPVEPKPIPTPVTQEITAIPINKIRTTNDEQTLEQAIINVKDGLVPKTEGQVLLTLNADGSYTINDGFHRIAQAILNKEKTISAEVRTETPEAESVEEEVEEERPYPMTPQERRRAILESRIKRGEPVPDKLLAEFPDLKTETVSSVKPEPPEDEESIDTALRTFEEREKARIPTREEYMERKMVEYKSALEGAGFPLDVKNQTEIINKEYDKKYPTSVNVKPEPEPTTKETPKKKDSLIAKHTETRMSPETGLDTEYSTEYRVIEAPENAGAEWMGNQYGVIRIFTRGGVEVDRDLLEVGMSPEAVVKALPFETSYKKSEKFGLAKTEYEKYEKGLADKEQAKQAKEQAEQAGYEKYNQAIRDLGSIKGVKKTNISYFSPVDNTQKTNEGFDVGQGVGVVIHKVGNSNEYAVTHINTGLAMGHNWKNRAEAIALAKSVAGVTDWSQFANEKEIPQEIMSKAASLVRGFTQKNLQSTPIEVKPAIPETPKPESITIQPKVETFGQNIVRAVEERPSRVSHGYTAKNAFYITKDNRIVPADKFSQLSKVDDVISVHSHSGENWEQYTREHGQEPFQPPNAADFDHLRWLVKHGYGNKLAVIMGDGRYIQVEIPKEAQSSFTRMGIKTLEKRLYPSKGASDAEHLTKLKAVAQEEGWLLTEGNWKG